MIQILGTIYILSLSSGTKVPELRSKMKKKMRMFVLLLILSNLLLLTGGSYVYRQRNQVNSIETTYVGNPKAMDGKEFMLTVQDSNKYIWETTYSFSNGMTSNTAFLQRQTAEEPLEYYNTLYPYIGQSDELSEFLHGINSDQVKSGKYYLKNFNDYMKIELKKSMYFSNVSCTQILKIKTPENAYIEVEIENQNKSYNSYIPLISMFDTPSIELDGNTYFTITNYGNLIENTMTEYEGISGIICAPSLIFESYGVETEITRDNVLYELEIGNDIDRQVLGISYREKEDCFVLAVKEEDRIWIHVVERETGNLVCKEEVASIPSNVQIISYNFFHQQDYIMVDYRYFENGNTEGESHRVVAAYELNSNNSLKVLLHYQYLSDILNNKDLDSLDLKNAEIKDMRYDNGSVFILGLGNPYVYNGNGIFIMVINEKGIQYLGKIHNSMAEDYSIGRYLYEKESVVDYSFRYIEGLEFLDN